MNYQEKTENYIFACFGDDLVEGYTEGLKLIQSMDDQAIFVWVGSYKNQAEQEFFAVCSEMAFHPNPGKPQQKYTFDPFNQKISLLSNSKKIVLQGDNQP